MAKRHAAELRQECLKANVTVTELLELGAVAAATYADENILSWMNEEIHGYAFADRVPLYRRLDVQPILVVSGTTPFVASLIPASWSVAAPASERTRVVRQSVESLERVLSTATFDQRCFLSQKLPEKFAFIADRNLEVQRVEGVVFEQQLNTLLTEVRRRLLEWADRILAREEPDVVSDTKPIGEAVRMSIFDAELSDRCADLLSKFQSPDHVHRLDTVIMEATKILETRIRVMVGKQVSDEERNLMSAVFGGEEPIIRLSEHKGEQEAGHLLFRGAYGFIRNPFHHRLVRIDRAERAIQMVGLVDYLLHLLDNAEMRTLR